ncbi:PepSY domain-containing protein [Jeongeupia sp. USM3]|uniref:PepSY-associated TM helix domain-containing protein n=1 Tax=Jeongeupia sp. USM3 TaxID=1906741 RepID=UPI00089DFD6C|nr:PepSY-associated TM helix domain-containing protein [Jeongeupia sp. USM3]AOY00727.1 hypothetical protein BJP62_09940 [Jeongeupia sp. USM3]
MFKSATLRVYQALHTWTGLIAGFALFVAFYAGAITVFHEELHTWQSPAARTAPASALSQAAAAIDAFVAAHPAARAEMTLVLPGSHSPQLSAWWFDGEWRHAPVGPAVLVDHGAGLSDLVNRIHYSLGIPEAGLYLMGIISVLYGLALVSGLIVHLPLLKKDLFALRPGKNLKRFWQDAHNVIGVLSLPFHLVFAVTGAIFCLFGVVLAAFDFAAFDGKLAAEVPAATMAAVARPAAGRPGAMLPPAELLSRARAAAPGFAPDALRYLNYGDASAVVEVRGRMPQSLGTYGGLALDAVSGRVLNVQLADRRDANHGGLSVVYGLHFGNYGGALVKGLYFLLGLAGAFLFYSGNLLWIEARRKRRHADQPRRTRIMAQATVGVCIGTCIGISAAFVATLAAQSAGISATTAEQAACFGAFFAALAWAFCRPPARAAIELLTAAGLVTLAIPLANAVLTGDHLLATPWRGEWIVFGVDAVALALGLGFLRLAVATHRRATTGDANSVWTLPPPARPATAVQTA